MAAAIDNSFRIGHYRFVEDYDVNAPIGGEKGIWVYGSTEDNDVDFRRTFYFQKETEALVHAFAMQFARDDQMRTECFSQSARWQRVEHWYIVNERVARLGGMAVPEESSLQRELQILYILLDRSLDVLERLPSYHALLQAEEGLHAEPAQVDPEMREAVKALSALPGTKVANSCQGIREFIRMNAWANRPIWIPSIHADLAFVQFDQAPLEVQSHLARCLKESGLGTYDREMRQFTSTHPEKNVDFGRALIDAAQSYSPEVNSEVLEQ